MYVISARTARSAATRLIIATAATATVCSYSPGLMATPQMTAAVMNAASITQAPSTIGIADSDLYGETPAEIDTTLDNLQSLGVQNIRIFVPWAFVEPASGTYNWSYLDEVVDAAAARNMGVLAEVSATPAWDAPSGTLPGAGTPNPTDYASFLTQVATRYGNDISSYEIWNEPNGVQSYDPISAATYTALLKAAYPAIKAVNPNATVVAGALGSVISYGNLTLNPVTFVQEMLADGAGGYFDALSFHPYQETLEFSQGASVPNSPLNQLNAIEQLLVANGLSKDKVWITEYGLPTADVSQQTQATYIQNLIDTWQTISYAGPVFIYTAQDGTSTDPNGTYGIYNADWTPKLAAAVIQQEIAKYAPAIVIPPVIAPVTTVAMQIATAFQTLAQQIATAFATAIANYAAALAASTAKAAMTTPAVSTPAVSVAAVSVAAPKTVPAATTPASTPAVSVPAVSVAPPKTVPAATTPASTPSATQATTPTAATPATTPSATQATTPTVKTSTVVSTKSVKPQRHTKLQQPPASA